MSHPACYLIDKRSILNLVKNYHSWSYLGVINEEIDACLPYNHCAAFY
jgi:hypothetical protein